MASAAFPERFAELSAFVEVNLRAGPRGRNAIFSKGFSIHIPIHQIRDVSVCSTVVTPAQV
jgi:hypothetical protein